jgi:hypothetical protein
MVKTIVGQLLTKKAKARPKGRNNRLSSRVQLNDNMNFSQRVGENKSVLVIKEEPIGVIASNNSANFGVLSTYAINPGQATSFPLLSQEAAEYETYLFEALEFFTVPLVSEYATGGQTGEVVIAVNFNASLPQPATQTATLTLEPCDGNLPCLPLEIRCPKEAMHKRSNAKFVRTGNLPGQSDIKEYDVGNLFVTGEGLSATQFNVCRLFVRYRCRLFTRVNLVNQGAPTNNSVSQLVSNANEAIVTATPYTVLFADVTAGDGYVNGLNAVNTNGSVLLPAGNYILTVNMAFGYTGNSTLSQVQIYKNATLVTASIGEINTPSGAYPNITVGYTSYVSLNGTDVIKIKATGNFSTGSAFVNGALTIMAI